VNLLPGPTPDDFHAASPFFVKFKVVNGRDSSTLWLRSYGPSPGRQDRIQECHHGAGPVPLNLG
jgi:hypothetical protein